MKTDWPMCGALHFTSLTYSVLRAKLLSREGVSAEMAGVVRVSIIPPALMGDSRSKMNYVVNSGSSLTSESAEGK